MSEHNPDTKVMTFHPSIASLLRSFAYDHLPPRLAEIARGFALLAWDLVARDGQALEGPEAAAALRKLLEAKDCAVRAALPERELVDPRSARPPRLDRRQLDEQA